MSHTRRHSSWHQTRLAHVDIERLRGDDLPTLSIMTKHDVMANWDTIVCDPELTLERLGHARPAFTIDTYQHVLPGMQTDAARVFE